MGGSKVLECMQRIRTMALVSREALWPLRGTSKVGLEKRIRLSGLEGTKVSTAGGQ